MPARASLTANEVSFVLQQRVAHLATSNATGKPHVVPVCFAYDGNCFYIVLDEKPKRVPDDHLQRVRNIQQRGEAALIIDRYDDDWSRLGYVLVSGRASIVLPASQDHAHAIAFLRMRYAQYRAMRLEVRPVIMVSPTHVSAWGAAPVSDTAPVAITQSSDPLLGRGLDFLPLARSRRSVRHFAPQPVERALLERALEAACWAPSPHGRQPWRFVVMTSPENKAQLAQAMGDEWQRILAMDGQPDAVVATRLRHSHERIRQAPVLILACLYLADLDSYPDPLRQEAEETMAVQSLGAAVENLLLSAHASGLDAGWMCAPLFCGAVVRSTLGLEPALLPHALITLGYAARDPIRRPRRPLHEMVRYLD